MYKTVALWSSGARKEALELLENLWNLGDDQVRVQLTEALIEGPPVHLITHEDPAEREASRDRRIFDRIGLLARDNIVSLTAGLNEMYTAITTRHPDWLLPAGEQARFGIWTETRSGPERAYSVQDLQAVGDIAQLVDLLCNTQSLREGLLDSWRELVASDSAKALAVLEVVRQREDGGAPDIWRTALWGLRGAIGENVVRDSLIKLLSEARESLFKHVEFSRAIADLLEAISSRSREQPSVEFWVLFDRALKSAEEDPENGDEPSDARWIETAINRSLGKLATAFLNALFNCRIKVSQGVPADQVQRINQLVGLGRRDHRLARVIAASRLPYLFAIDPSWTRETLIPVLSWTDEDEAVALWQGFSWHPRVGPELWTEISNFFLASFTPNRLAKLGEADRTMAQLLMLGGVAFGPENLSTECAQAAIRAMSPAMHDTAIWWIRGYLAGEGDDAESPKGERADALWRDRVEPWLKRAWPRDRTLRTASLAQRFALVAITTSEAFREAVEFVMPFLIKGDASMVIDELKDTRHSEQHPEATLRLLDAITDTPALGLANDLGEILDTIGRAQPDLCKEPAFRRLDELRRH